MLNIEFKLLHCIKVLASLLNIVSAFVSQRSTQSICNLHNISFVWPLKIWQYLLTVTVTVEPWQRHNSWLGSDRIFRHHKLCLVFIYWNTHLGKLSIHSPKTTVTNIRYIQRYLCSRHTQAAEHFCSFHICSHKFYTNNLHQYHEYY